MFYLILELFCYQITNMFGLSEGAVIWSRLMCVMQRKLGKNGASQDDSGYVYTTLFSVFRLHNMCIIKYSLQISMWVPCGIPFLSANPYGGHHPNIFCWWNLWGFHVGASIFWQPLQKNIITGFLGSSPDPEDGFGWKMECLLTAMCNLGWLIYTC